MNFRNASSRLRAAVSPFAMVMLWSSAQAQPPAAPNAPTAPATPAAKEGATLYQQFCQQCHGPRMVSPGTAAFDLRTFPLDQHDRFVQSVLNGKGNMPSWQGVITPSEIEQLWAYVRTRGAE